MKALYNAPVRFSITKRLCFHFHMGRAFGLPFADMPLLLKDHIIHICFIVFLWPHGYPSFAYLDSICVFPCEMSLFLRDRKSSPPHFFKNFFIFSLTHGSICDRLDRADIRRCGGMVDTGDLKSPGSNTVPVRVRSPAPFLVQASGQYIAG